MTSVANLTAMPGDRAVAPLATLPLDRLGQVDVDALGQDILAIASRDAPAALARLDEAASALTPVQAGQLLRLVSDVPGVPLPLLPEIPGVPRLPTLPGLPSLPNPADLARLPLQQLQRLADSVTETLGRLPHETADALADSMRGNQARPLTSAERAVIREAYGNRIDLDEVRIVDGAGWSPAAHAAFKVGGNPAITIGDTIYLAENHYSADLGQPGVERELLLHEFAHVVQYEEMGYRAFAAKYAGDLAAHDYDRNAVYRYHERQTTYAQETIEGQAEMVGDYARLRGSTRAADQPAIQDLERRLAGTGIYGL